MREGCKGLVASEAWSGGAGGAATRCISDWGRLARGKGVNLTDGARLTERRGRGGQLGKTRTKKENVFPMKTRPMRGLDGPAGTISAYGDGATGGLAGPEAKRATGSAEPKIRKKEISELKLDF
jgi:hypothetical protein